MWPAGQAPEPFPPPPANEPGSPLLVVAAIGVAALVLIGVLLAVRLGASDDNPRTVTVDDVFGTTTPSNTNTNPPASSATTAPTATTAPGPSGSTVAPTRSDLTVTHHDSTGRFTVSVPRTWLYGPTQFDTAVQWAVTASDAGGALTDTGVKFTVRWAASQGRDLEACADEVDRALQSNNPSAAFTRQATTVNGMPAVRLDGIGSENHLTAWVVAQGDRYWVPQFVSPSSIYDGAESIVLAVMDTFSTE